MHRGAPNPLERAIVDTYLKYVPLTEGMPLIARVVEEQFSTLLVPGLPFHRRSCYAAQEEPQSILKLLAGTGACFKGDGRNTWEWNSQC
jgi:hypothetical protein